MIGNIMQRSTVLLYKLIVAHIIKNCVSFYGPPLVILTLCSCTVCYA